MHLQNYVRWLIDFKQSVLGGVEHFDAMEAALAAGENVVILANHQTEADPGVLQHHAWPDSLVAIPICEPRGIPVPAWLRIIMNLVEPMHCDFAQNT